MKANDNFVGKSKSFWGYVKLISEKLGYSKRGQDAIKKYSEQEIRAKLEKENINIDDRMLNDVREYTNYRADVLNSQVKILLMDVEEAYNLFNEFHQQGYINNNLTCKLPYNKQKNEKSGYAYFTGIINILAEMTLRDFAKHNNLEYGKDLHFDDDPTNLTYIKDNQEKIIGILSRRFDGAYPSTVNPVAVWEIKEYYYTTTFGSRIADGVYETQLDGFEVNSIFEDLPIEAPSRPRHIYFIDARYTWWSKGKSYLCRIIDMLHEGLVDEVIFGKEVIERWPVVLRTMLTNNINITDEAGK